MRPSANRPGPSTDSGSFPGKLDPGAQNGPDGTGCSLDALESALAAVRERVARLETDLRNLQSQTANRS